MLNILCCADGQCHKDLLEISEAVCTLRDAAWTALRPHGSHTRCSAAYTRGNVESVDAKSYASEPQGPRCSAWMQMQRRHSGRFKECEGRRPHNLFIPTDWVCTGCVTTPWCVPEDFSALTQPTLTPANLFSLRIHSHVRRRGLPVQILRKVLSGTAPVDRHQRLNRFAFFLLVVLIGMDCQNFSCRFLALRLLEGPWPFGHPLTSEVLCWP